jgi:release factor glutamine methyltransferase
MIDAPDDRQPTPNRGPRGPSAAALGPIELRAALREAIDRLRAARIPSHALDAELLLMHALGRDRTWLHTHPEAPLDQPTAETYFALVARRSSGEPTQYINGKQEFWGLGFEVTPAVLIPRPETEHVVEAALERLGARSSELSLGSGASSARWQIADVGTGSGCLAVALAHELPRAEIIATDISGAALEVASRNAARHGVSDRVHFLETNLLEALLPERAAPADRARRFNLIVSNPPYVGRDDWATLPREVREYEPATALLGGQTGMEMYEPLIEQARSLLPPGGILIVELGCHSADHVRAIFARQPGWRNLAFTPDLAGIPRVLTSERAE